MTIMNDNMESKEKILKYLHQKQELTVGVQNARYEISVSKSSFIQLKKQFRRYFLLIFAAIIIAIFTLNTDGMFYSILSIFWLIGLVSLIYLRFLKGTQAKSIIRNATLNLENEKFKKDYLNGMQDFPNKFYSYFTIERLISLVKENRATTLQEAFNIAENQDFQSDQLALHQENLAVAKSTHTMASISAVANVGTFLNTRNK
ncbi:conserved hypothetical protein [Pseudolactococcus piscium]|nr:conserved hypothetical protein [Lactococcus piscium]